MSNGLIFRHWDILCRIILHYSCGAMFVSNTAECSSGSRSYCSIYTTCQVKCDYCIISCRLLWMSIKGNCQKINKLKYIGCKWMSPKKDEVFLSAFNGFDISYTWDGKITIFGPHYLLLLSVIFSLFTEISGKMQEHLINHLSSMFASLQLIWKKECFHLPLNELCNISLNSVHRTAGICRILWLWYVVVSTSASQLEGPVFSLNSPFYNRWVDPLSVSLPMVLTEMVLVIIQ